MFINENTSNMYYNESTADPVYMYEAVLEASEAYHNLCMKMVKCEHVAIVNEDTAMMSEAAGDFKKKATEIAKTLLAKFMAFIDRVRAEWSKLWAGVLSKLVSTETVKKMREYINQNARVSVEADLKGIKAMKPFYQKVFSTFTANAGNLDAIMSGILAAMPKETKENKTITFPDIEVVCNFLEERPEYIKGLEILKKNAKNLYENDIRESQMDNSEGGNKKDQLLLARYSSLISKCIVRINGYTADAVRICRAVIAKGKSNPDYAADKKSEKIVNKTNKENERHEKRLARITANESASILDLFE